MADRHLRSYVARWLRHERRFYADVKWEEDRANYAAKVEGMRQPGQEYWFDFVNNYLRRAQLFDLSTLAGRQALGKALVTLFAMTEMAVDVHGPMPSPGVPSGEVTVWEWPRPEAAA